MNFDLFNKVRDIFIDYKNKAFLARYGCKTIKEYNKKFDIDYSIRSSEIKKIYFGYPYVYCLTDNNHPIYNWNKTDYNDTLVTIDNWCEKNLADKFRFDFHRVSKNYFNEWVIDEIGGGDYIFAAFKNEKDYVRFLLRWQ